MSSNAAPKVTFQMAFFIILFLAMASLVVESAAAGRAMLSANSNDTVEATSKSQPGTGTQWAQVTTVPLAVFLIGACVWDIIQNHLINDVSNVGLDSAQEEGFELPVQCPIDATGLAATLNSPATDASDEMQPELSNLSNGEETEDVGASVQTSV